VVNVGEFQTMTPDQRRQLIAQRMMEQIKKLGWTTNRLGSAVGLKKMQPSRWKSGETSPPSTWRQRWLGSLGYRCPTSQGLARTSQKIAP
jgi:hypothetical protein